MLKSFILPALAVIMVAPAFAAETRVIEAANGAIEIPAQPQRIVSLHDLSITLPLVEFGGTDLIVGSHGRTDADGNPYIRTVNQLFDVDYDNTDIGFIGVQNQIDVEAVAALEPDVIIGRAGFDDELAPNLAKIAPVVLVDVNDVDYFKRMRAVAEIAGLTERYDALLALYLDRVAEAQRLLPDAADISVSVIQPWPNDGYINGSRRYYALTQVLDDIGFAKPQAIADLPGEDAEFSAEFLPDLDADFIFSTYEVANADQASPQLILDGFERIMPGYCELLHACRNNQQIVVPRSPVFAASFRSLEIAYDHVLTHIVGRAFVPYAAE